MLLQVQTLLSEMAFSYDVSSEKMFDTWKRDLTTVGGEGGTESGITSASCSKASEHQAKSEGLVRG